jgi:hypothetical protein
MLPDSPADASTAAPAHGGGAVARDPFIGRERELALLRGALADALDGRGRLALLVGEPGIGKTRLADEVSVLARDAGAAVLWGRCWEGPGAPAFWPWRQLLRAWLEDRDVKSVRSTLGPAVDPLLPLLPELADGDEADRDRARLPEGDRDRFALFNAVVELLRSAGREEPLLLVLDDLHDADPGSLLLLEFVTRLLRDLRALVIATYRDAEARLSGPLSQRLGAITREGRHLQLQGFSSDDIAAYLAAHAEVDIADEVAADLAATVHATTDGNPFFVQEVVHLLAAEGKLRGERLRPSALGVPEGVRAAIRRRLAQLPERTLDVLTAAAVIGREFDPAVLAGMMRLEMGELLAVIGPAQAAGVTRDAATRADCFEFAHALVRQTLYRELLPDERMRLHRRAGAALVDLHAADLDAHASEIAEQYLLATTPDDARTAIDFCRRAARHASRLLGHEQAAAHLQQAVAIADLAHLDEAARAELLLELIEAQVLTGNKAAARTTLYQVAEIARREQDPVLLGRAALAGADGTGQPGRDLVDPGRAALIEEALAALGDRDAGLRSRLLGRLAVERSYLDRRDRREAMVSEAVALARSTGDPATLAAALTARHHALWGVEDIGERLVAATQILEVAEVGRDADLTLQGLRWRIVALLEQGDRSGAEAEIAAHARAAARHQHSYGRWKAAVFDALLALLDGRFAEADRLSVQALEIGQAQQAAHASTSIGDNAAMTHAVQQFALRRQVGRLPTLEPTVTELAQRYPALPVWRCALAYLHAEAGQIDEARDVLRALGPFGVASLPRDGNWAAAVSLLVEVSDLLGDAGAARELYGHLLPLAGSVIVVAQGQACRGAVDHYLGLAALTARRLEEAQSHLATAERLHRRLRAGPLLGQTRLAQGRLWCVRDAPGDAARAHAALDEAADIGRSLGMASLLARITAVRDEGRQAPVVPAPGAAVAPLVREGDVWTLRADGRVLRLRDSKGMRHLARLLAQPGREIHALELVALDRGGDPRIDPDQAMAGQVVEADLHADSGAGEVLLDQPAKVAYRRRMTDLEQEIDDAELARDQERAAQAKEELDVLVRELSAAVGMGGRDRRSAAPAERARVNVTRALRMAIQRITEHDAHLGHHLDRSVRTGVFCSYVPDPRTPVRWGA